MLVVLGSDTPHSNSRGSEKLHNTSRSADSTQTHRAGALEQAIHTTGPVWYANNGNANRTAKALAMPLRTVYDHLARLRLWHGAENNKVLLVILARDTHNRAA